MRFNKHIEHIKVYEAGKPIELVVREYGIAPSDVIKMASNENPFGTPPEVQEIIRGYAANAFRYPDDSMYELKQALSRRFDVDSTSVIIGAGSDQIIDFAVKAKCDEDAKIITSGVTFAMYEIYAKQIGARVIKTRAATHEIEEIKELYKRYGADLVFLCLPNNPMGDCMSRDEVEHFLEFVDSDTLVVLDGAYQEYATFKDPAKAINPKDIVLKYPNALYLGTFSKAYGLGGLRIGYGIAQKGIIDALYKLRPPFNITNLSLAAATKALECESFIQESLSVNFEEMQKYERFLEKKEIKYIDSYTNFITIVFEKLSSSEVAERLLKVGIIVRDLASYGVNGIRVTIDLPEKNDRFLAVFDALLTEMN